MDQSQYLNDQQSDKPSSLPQISSKRSPFKSSTVSASSPLSLNSFSNTKNPTQLGYSIQNQLRQNLLNSSSQHGKPPSTASNISLRFSSDNYPNINQNQPSFSNTTSPSSRSNQPSKVKLSPLPSPQLDIRQSIWQGSIPIRFVLSPDETIFFNNSNRQTIDYYVTVPRISYLPIYIDRAVKYFRPYLSNPDFADTYCDWWAEYQSIPLRWNWPVGLLYDTVKCNTNIAKSKDEAQAETLPIEKLTLDSGNMDNGELTLPWTIILHHKNYPKDTVLALASPTTLFEYWMNLVKESCVIRYGSANAIMNLSKDDSDKLWGCIFQYTKDSYKTFWKILDSQYPPLVHASAQDGGNNNNNNNSSSSNSTIKFKNIDFHHSSESKKLQEYQERVEASQIKHIPIKVYLPMSSYGIQYLVSPYASSSTSSPTTSTGVTSSSLLSSSSAQSPLSQSIIHHTTFDDYDDSTSSKPEQPKGIQTLGTVLNKHVSSLFPSKRRCVVATPVLHGIEVPLTTPVLDLLDQCSYPDGFLHISIGIIDQGDNS